MLLEASMNTHYDKEHIGKTLERQIKLWFFRQEADVMERLHVLIVLISYQGKEQHTDHTYGMEPLINAK